MNECKRDGADRDDVICERSFRICGQTYLLRYSMRCSSYGEDEPEAREFCYGVGIRQYRRISEFEYELCDSAFVKGFSDSCTETRIFMRRLCEGMVLPMSLEEIVDDWKSAFS